MAWPGQYGALSAQYFARLDQTGNLPHPHIAVSATGMVAVSPDRATIYFALTTADSTPRLAASETEALRTRVVRAVAPVGIRAEEVTPWGFGVGPRRGFVGSMRGPTPQVAAGLEAYGARMGIRVVVDSLDRFDEVISAALEAGEVSIPVVTFEARNVIEARQAAIAQAVRDVMADAAALAEAAGGTLGELLFLTSTPTPDFGNPLVTMYQSGPGFDTPLQPNDVTVRVMVTAAWRLGT